MIRELTSLRFIFIIFLFLHHAVMFRGGDMSVCFFFVLGGFCMTLGYKERLSMPGFRVGGFILKRLFKFYPLHWICLLASLPLVHFCIENWSVFAVNALLLQSFIPKSSVYFSYNAVSWYLADTVFFTFIFPLAGRFIFGLGRRGVWCVGVFVVVSYALLACLLPVAYRHAIMYVNPFVRCADFIMGILLALGYERLRRNERIASFVKGYPLLIQLMIIFSVVLLVIESYMLSDDMLLVPGLFWPLVAVCIVSAALASVNGGWLQNRILVRLGECSFAFYMVHHLVIRYFENIPVFHSDRLLLTAVTFAVSLALSLVYSRVSWLTRRS